MATKTRIACTEDTKNMCALWVHKVNNFSSQYNDSTWSANCVIGTPKVYPKYGDINGAWAHRDSNTRQEFIEVEFQEKLFIREMDIYETYNAGAVVKVEFRSPSGEWIPFFETQTPVHLTISRIFQPPLQEPRFKTKEARITLDCTAARSWCELDAIQIKGTKFKAALPPPADDLSRDLKHLVNNDRFCDVTFEVEGKTVPGHKAILASRSSYFNAMFGVESGKTWNETATEKAIPIKDVRYSSFLGLMEFLYTNKLDDSLAPEVLTDLVRVADRFSLEGLITLCVYRISEIMDNENVVFLYREATEQLPVLDTVKDMCLDHISYNMNKVSKTKAFTALSQDVMLEIIQETTARMSIT